MGNNNDKKNNVNLKLKSFDLGEYGGGVQMILAQKSISETEHYVVAIGEEPSIEIVTQENGNTDECLVKPKEIPEDGERNVKLRWFKLSQAKGKDDQYAITEFVTPESISRAAEMFKRQEEKENN